ncbi:MAG: hypothetical protein FD123_4371 [Bacteroidetes bacterium]|nr:MAG: hypothetical protein FD123_4371 [Bacteroidota bacterium]
MKKIAAPILFAGLFAGCASNETAESSAVKQSEICQTYYVSWVGEMQQYRASATFRFGGATGTTLHLSSPSEVKFNGQKMNEEKMLFGGATYGFESKSYSETSTFEFMDTDKKKYTNSFSFAGIDFKENPQKISSKSAFEIELTRDITTADQVKLHVQDTLNAFSADIKTGTASAEVRYDAASKKLVIQPSFFRTMADVPLTLWLEASFTDRTLKESADKGGTISFSYTSREIKVTRVEDVQ